MDKKTQPTPPTGLTRDPDKETSTASVLCRAEEIKDACVSLPTMLLSPLNRWCQVGLQHWVRQILTRLGKCIQFASTLLAPSLSPVRHPKVVRPWPYPLGSLRSDFYIVNGSVPDLVSLPSWLSPGLFLLKAAE